MLALLCSSFLVSSALAHGGWGHGHHHGHGHNHGPLPPHLRGCSNITVKSEGNCPRSGYECDESWPVKYEYGTDGRKSEVTCPEYRSQLAVGKRIVDQVVCHGKKWKAEGNCNIPTTSVVCAKFCDYGVCSSGLNDAPRQYVKPQIDDANDESPCAQAICKFGFVALLRNLTVIAEYPSSQVFTCAGDKKWKTTNAAGEVVKHKYIMCNKRGVPNPPCEFTCNGAPWTSPLINATSAAIRKGCTYSCPAGQVLSRPEKTFAVALTCAQCRHDGFFVNGNLVVPQIGCSTCDVENGAYQTNVRLRGNKPAIAAGCTLSCDGRKDKLWYGLTDNKKEAKYVRGGILYRQFTATANSWITPDGIVLTPAHWIGCEKHSCI